MKKLMYLSLAAFLMTSASSLSFAAGSGGGEPVEAPKCKKGEVRQEGRQYQEMRQG